MLMLVFPAVLGRGEAFGPPSGALLTLSLGGFIAFCAGSIPAGWLGDRWSRRNMITVFFLGIGAATMANRLASTPTELAVALPDRLATRPSRRVRDGARRARRLRLLVFREPACFPDRPEELDAAPAPKPARGTVPAE